MYRIIREGGDELGITEKINYIRKAANGCYILNRGGRSFRNRGRRSRLPAGRP